MTTPLPTTSQQAGRTIAELRNEWVAHIAALKVDYRAGKIGEKAYQTKLAALAGVYQDEIDEQRALLVEAEETGWGGS